MYEVRSEETFRIGGRGTVKIVRSADLPRARVGDVLRIDGVAYELRGVASAPVGEFVGLVVRPAEMATQDSNPASSSTAENGSRTVRP